ncbi:MAG: hypothetical protein JXR44_07665 [Thiotrichales bacterium]|nr:hypothetical protein [Thiotrichales bacterium]
MKKFAALFALAAFTSALSASVIAGSGYAEPTPMHHAHHAHHGHKHSACGQRHAGDSATMSPEKRQALQQLRVENRLERMDRKLDLTAEQETKIRTLLQQQQEKQRQLRQQTREAIDALLTEEQKQKRQAAKQAKLQQKAPA